MSRVFTAAEAKAVGCFGIAAVWRATGIAPSTIGRAPGDIRAACCRKSRACRAMSIAEAVTYNSNIRERSFFGLLGPSMSPARENAVGNPRLRYGIRGPKFGFGVAGLG